MRTILVLIIFSLFQYKFPEKLILDVTKTNQLNVSEIADKITSVPLKNIEIKNIGAEKVFLINESIFILQRFQEEGINYSYVVKFDMNGNNQGKLETKDPKSNDPLYIVDMLYNDSNKYIFLIYSNGYGKFDSNGKLVSFNNYNWKNGDSNILHPFMFIFKGQIWLEEISKNNDAVDLKLVHTNLNFQEKEIIKSFNSFLSEAKGVIPAFSLSASNNELYVSFMTDNIIYRVHQGVLSPVFKLEIKDRSSSNSDIKPRQEIIGKYIKNGYWSNWIEHDFLYNTDSKKSYNVKYDRNKDNIQMSGIKDDYYNTGYFKFNQTNREDYIYYIKKPTELKESKLYDPKQTNTILFLVKLK